MKLKILRVLAMMTQAEAAAAANVTQSVVSDWEKGKYRPNPAAVTKLAEAYRVTVDDVIQAVADTMAKEKRKAKGKPDSSLAAQNDEGEEIINA